MCILIKIHIKTNAIYATVEKFSLQSLTTVSQNLVNMKEIVRIYIKATNVPAHPATQGITVRKVWRYILFNFL